MKRDLTDEDIEQIADLQTDVERSGAELLDGLRRLKAGEVEEGHVTELARHREYLSRRLNKRLEVHFDLAASSGSLQER